MNREEQEGLAMEMVRPLKGKLALQVTVVLLQFPWREPPPFVLLSERMETREEEAAAAIAMDKKKKKKKKKLWLERESALERGCTSNLFPSLTTYLYIHPIISIYLLICPQHKFEIVFVFFFFFFFFFFFSPQ